MSNVLTPEQTRTLVRKFARGGAELDEQYRRACDLQYWLSLNPGLTIGSPECLTWDAADDSSDELIRDAHVNYRTHGFAFVPGVLSSARSTAMRQAVEAVRNADWLPVFSFVYDDFWFIGRAAPLRKLLSSVLSQSYRLLPRIWTHYVYPTVGQAGWGPHLDGTNGDVHTTSVWIPLANATLTNGCMYVVKRSEHTADLCGRYHDTDTFTREQVEHLLRNTRALPADVGSVLCWDETTLHWGGRFEIAKNPRVSLALEFTTAAFQLSNNDPALIDPQEAPPGIDFRLRTIGRAILRYRQFEPLIERFAPLATRLSQVST